MKPLSLRVDDFAGSCRLYWSSLVVVADIDLELFLKFNKIRTLVSDVETLARALKKSEFLQVWRSLNHLNVNHEKNFFNYNTWEGKMGHGHSSDEIRQDLSVQFKYFYLGLVKYVWHWLFDQIFSFGLKFAILFWLKFMFGYLCFFLLIFLVHGLWFCVFLLNFFGFLFVLVKSWNMI